MGVGCIGRGSADFADGIIINKSDIPILYIIFGAYEKEG
jgi:hypothetical protein